MKLKHIAILSTVALFLLFVTGKSLYMYIQSQKDYKRVLGNEMALHAQVNYYSDALGRETAKTWVMEYTVNELKNLLPEVSQALQELKIKTKHVQSYSQASIQQFKEIDKPLHDTTIIINTIHTQAKAFVYSDPWYYVSGIVRTDSVKLRIQSTDTIIQVVSRGPRPKPWLWFFSPRTLQQTIQSRNPSNHIAFSRYISIKK